MPATGRASGPSRAASVGTSRGSTAASSTNATPTSISVNPRLRARNAQSSMETRPVSQSTSTRYLRSPASTVMRPPVELPSG